MCARFSWNSVESGATWLSIRGMERAGSMPQRARYRKRSGWARRVRRGSGRTDSGLRARLAENVEMPSLELVCLDAGGVLVNPNFERIAEALRRHGVSVEAARLAAAEPFAKRELDTAALIRATNDRARGWRYFDLVLAHAGVASGAQTQAALQELAAYHARHNLWESVPPEVLPGLERLRALGVRLAVVSNSNGTLRDKLQRLGLAPAFDLVIDSSEVGVEKPDARIFRITLERLQVGPDRAVHLGDFFNVDVTGARSAEIEAWLLDSAGLYPDCDAPRVRSLTEFVDAVSRR